VKQLFTILVLELVFVCNVGAQGRTYTTNFPATENPVSQGGNWVNGRAVGLDWSDARTIPGLAFGTGTHPTTALCLQILDSLPVADRTVIDYGCGSGILGIAALKLGAAHVWAVDLDPQAQPPPPRSGTAPEDPAPGPRTHPGHQPQPAPACYEQPASAPPSTPSRPPSRPSSRPIPPPPSPATCPHHRHPRPQTGVSARRNPAALLCPTAPPARAEVRPPGAQLYLPTPLRGCQPSRLGPIPH